MSEPNMNNVPAEDIKKIEKPIVEANVFKPYDVVVNAPALKLHADPKHDSKVVRIVREGVILTVTEEKTGYCKVGDAWASKKFVKRK